MSLKATESPDFHKVPKFLFYLGTVKNKQGGGVGALFPEKAGSLGRQNEGFQAFTAFSLAIS